MSWKWALGGIAAMLVALVACQYNWRRDVARVFEQECKWLVECAEAYDHRRACEEARWQDLEDNPADPYCLFDPVDAHDCEDALSELTCDDDLYEEGHPEPCLRWWTDCGEEGMDESGIPPLE